MTRFTKAHAYGNDFLYVRQADVEGASLTALARELCDRHTGVGADGLVVYEGEGSTCRMRLFNADGSRAEVSGNGVRALGAVLLHEDPRPSATLTIDTEAGPKRLTRLGRHDARQIFRTAMGLPTDLRGSVEIEAAGEALRAAVLNMGNPQCVVLGPLPDESRFRRLGAAIERHALFPMEPTWSLHR